MPSSSSSFELFVLSIMQEDVHTLRVRSDSVCESFGPTTCLQHENGVISFSAFAQGHNKKACRLVVHTIIIVLNDKPGSREYHFLKSFGMTRLDK